MKTKQKKTPSIGTITAEHAISIDAVLARSANLFPGALYVIRGTGKKGLYLIRVLQHEIVDGIIQGARLIVRNGEESEICISVVSLANRYKLMPGDALGYEVVNYPSRGKAIRLIIGGKE